MVDTAAVETSDLVFKIVVSGPTGAGKTTFIDTITQRSPDEPAERHLDTGDGSAVGMDYGTFAVADPTGDIQLQLFGAPGEERFRFMWEILAEGADGLVMVVDGREPDGWREARNQLNVLQAVAAAPGIVAVNHDRAPSTIEAATSCFASTGLQVIACDAADHTQVADALLRVLTATLQRIESDDEQTREADAW
ncbi:MAG: ADP-ribosylation factor-like protein [Actinomycetota bacterium]